MTEILYSSPTQTEKDACCSPAIIAQHDRIKKEVTAEVINSVPNPTIILNKDRRIVFYNESLEKAVGLENQANRILGRRPGDLLQCCNTKNNWCGEAGPCAQCGAFIAIKSAMDGEKTQEECLLLTNIDGQIKGYTFMVTASPILIKDEEFFIIHLSDISDIKHKEMMERVFLHDLLNSVNGIANAGTLIMEDATSKEHRELAAMIVDRAYYMASEINAHRLFLSAETKQLEVNNEPIALEQLVDSVCSFYKDSLLAKEKNISINCKIEEFSLTTDKRLLHRIIENLVKNAYEASPENGVVTVQAREENGNALISVSNMGAVSIPVAHQIFKKSFSTKGPGRGLGTYSVKMFTENYLRGRAWFDSSQEEGTNFHIELPLSPTAESLVKDPCPRGLRA
ncbi:ATP-binding protein [Maridesulfovibrio sp.]|uniref:sensor histidine kinase n=1 Tax=Maridesulfovibrio sp. TaxID=2795000 RepID=UPI0029F4DB4F|nr:ATP-binding protein [Maridesulfovibrio sp.]